MTTQKDYNKLDKEFDDAVTKFNAWLTYSISPQGRRKSGRNAFYSGMRSVMTSFSRQAKFAVKPSFHPYFKKHDLTPRQEDVISVASDWTRAVNNLEERVAHIQSLTNVSQQDAEKAKSTAQDIYQYLKQVYINEALRK